MFKSTRSSLFIIVSVLALVFTYQNCGISNNSFKSNLSDLDKVSSNSNILSDGFKNSNDNFQGGNSYDGKVTGSYYNIEPGHMCGGQLMPKSILHFTDNGVFLETNENNMCGVVSQIDKNDLDIPIYGELIVGHGDKIYETVKEPVEVKNEYVEVWCQGLVENDEFQSQYNKDKFAKLIYDYTVTRGIQDLKSKINPIDIRYPLKSQDKAQYALRSPLSSKRIINKKEKTIIFDSIKKLDQNINGPTYVTLTIQLNSKLKDSKGFYPGKSAFKYDPDPDAGRRKIDLKCRVSETVLNEL